jgi:hypothetical protein
VGGFPKPGEVKNSKECGLSVEVMFENVQLHSARCQRRFQALHRIPGFIGHRHVFRGRCTFASFEPFQKSTIATYDVMALLSQCHSSHTYDGALPSSADPSDHGGMCRSFSDRNWCKEIEGNFYCARPSRLWKLPCQREHPNLDHPVMDSKVAFDVIAVHCRARPRLHDVGIESVR